MTINDLKQKLEPRETETLDELSGYFSDSEIIDMLINDEDFGDELHEIADGRVSVYTADQMEWLTNNIDHADQTEAIACGAKTAQEIAAFCWYQAEMEKITEDIQKMKSLVEE